MALDDAQAALQVFQDLGAVREVERVSSLIESLSAPAPVERSKATDASGLSPREIEVLRLVSGGRSNDEIAADLYLSVRTVERHVSTIYEKLGLSGKAARAAAAAYALNKGI